MPTLLSWAGAMLVALTFAGYGLASCDAAAVRCCFEVGEEGAGSFVRIGSSLCCRSSSGSPFCGCCCGVTDCCYFCCCCRC